MPFVLGAFGLFACARQDEAPVHAPLAEKAAIKTTEPPSLPAEVKPTNTDEEDHKAVVLDQFGRWAQDNIRFAFSSRHHRFDACFDRADVEVACSNPKAARQETRVWDEVASTVVNRSDAPVTCEPSGSTNERVVLPPKGTHTFSILTKPRAVGAERDIVSVRCSMPLKNALKLGMPTTASKRIDEAAGLVRFEASWP